MDLSNPRGNGVRDVVRGGRDQFKWSSVATQPLKDRECYLGQSVMVGMQSRKGRFLRNEWWMKEAEEQPVDEEELKHVQEQERILMEQKLGNKQKKKRVEERIYPKDERDAIFDRPLDGDEVEFNSQKSAAVPETSENYSSSALCDSKTNDNNQIIEKSTRRLKEKNNDKIEQKRSDSGEIHESEEKTMNDSNEDARREYSEKELLLREKECKKNNRMKDDDIDYKIQSNKFMKRRYRDDKDNFAEEYGEKTHNREGKKSKNYGEEYYQVNMRGPMSHRQNCYRRNSPKGYRRRYECDAYKEPSRSRFDNNWNDEKNADLMFERYRKRERSYVTSKYGRKRFSTNED